jgi:hypothetical protein
MLIVPGGEIGAPPDREKRATFAPPLHGAGPPDPCYPGFRHPCGVPSPGATAQRPLRGSRPDPKVACFSPFGAPVPIRRWPVFPPSGPPSRSEGGLFFPLRGSRPDPKVACFSPSGLPSRSEGGLFFPLRGSRPDPKVACFFPFGAPVPIRSVAHWQPNSKQTPVTRGWGSGAPCGARTPSEGPLRGPEPTSLPLAYSSFNFIVALAVVCYDPPKSGIEFSDSGAGVSPQHPPIVAVRSGAGDGGVAEGRNLRSV